MGNKLTEEQARNKLAVYTDRYILNEYAPGASALSLFYDSDLGRKVTYKYNGLIQKLKKNPDFIPNPPAAVKEKLYKQGYQKRKASLLKKHGVEHPSQLGSVKDKKKNTNLEKYGVETNLQVPSVLETVAASFLNKYGAGSAAGSPSVIKKSIETKIKNGVCSTVEGKTVKEWSKKLGKSKTSIYKWLEMEHINSPKDIPDFYTRIEEPISLLLDSLNVTYVYNKKLEGSSFKPDFLVPDHNLIIECDGLYWHSDAVCEDKYYNRNKQKEYNKLGYRSLFFREDEILGKLDVVSSIILNALNKNPDRIFARKCTVRELDPSFFEQHHLMGKGAGRSYGLFYENEPVAGIQVKWVNKDTKLLDVSRFCSKPEVTVVGGFSKLLSYVEKTEEPNCLQTFIDKRYGTGSYLEELGFEASKSYLSFKWTNFQTIYNRMQFRNDSGYEQGLFKVWDCGQTKFRKHL